MCEINKTDNHVENYDVLHSVDNTGIPQEVLSFLYNYYFLFLIILYSFFFDANVFSLIHITFSDLLSTFNTSTMSNFVFSI
jgi:uncharacterized protein YqhQ